MQVQSCGLLHPVGWDAESKSDAVGDPLQLAFPGLVVNGTAPVVSHTVLVEPTTVSVI